MLCSALRGMPHRSLVLSVFFAGLVGGAGCSRPPLPIAPHRYVRLDALLPLHPSWEQIRSMDHEIARLKTAPNQAGAMRFEPFPALPVFVPRVAAPANRAAERASQIEQDAARYLASLRKSLASANQSILSLERRREQRRVEAAVAESLADAAKKLRDENQVKIFAIAQRIRTLALRDIVVRSRIQDLAQARTADLKPLRDAQAEHAAILIELDRLKAENRVIVTQDVVAETARKRDAFLREEQAKSKERLAKREEDLKSEAQDKIAEAMRRQRDTAIPPPIDRTLPPPDPRRTPLPLHIESSVTMPVSPAVQTALSRQSTVWLAQRAALLDEIRTDTRKAVKQIALRRGWRLEDGPAPGALDGTDEAADELRTQWTMGKSP